MGGIFGGGGGGQQAGTSSVELVNQENAARDRAKAETDRINAEKEAANEAENAKIVSDQAAIANADAARRVKNRTLLAGLSAEEANRLTSGGSGVASTTLGTAGGAETVTLSVAEMPAHSHAQNMGSNFGTSGGSPIGASGSNAGSAGFNTASAGSGNAHNNTQPSYVVNKIIKL